MTAAWKVMANPKTQGIAGPAGTGPLNPKYAARNSSEEWPQLKCAWQKWEEMEDPQLQSQRGKLQWERGGPTN